MARTIENAFVDKAIECVERTHKGYSFWLKDIPIEISIALLVNPINGGFNFQLSHFIKTPVQMTPYRPSRTWGDDEAYALHLAITAITDYYNQAVNEGHIPSNSWLVTR